MTVAPLTGAWIETSVTKLNPGRPYVAPLTGAWIETLLGISSAVGHMSHPSRVRGLKLRQEHILCGHEESHPSRVRGLKQYLGQQLFRRTGRTPHGCVD